MKHTRLRRETKMPRGEKLSFYEQEQQALVAWACRLQPDSFAEFTASHVAIRMIGPTIDALRTTGVCTGQIDLNVTRDDALKAVKASMPYS
jgi:hypothetical protein